MQPLITFLWFDNQAEEAANYYVSLFPNSRITQVLNFTDATTELNGKPSGSVMAVDFELNGSLFSALNGGQIPGFNFTPATSFMIRCQNQEEIDRYWAALSAVPEAEQCGWCTDKFGITWQVVPEILNELMSDPQKAERATKAFLPMKKFDLATLLEAV